MASGIKAITQDTFDCVVQENVNDFCMDEAEALEDAIQQFISQGVPLTMIIKAVRINGNHEVINVVNSLKQSINSGASDSDHDELKKILTSVSSYFKSDMANRYQASKLASAEDVIFQCCQRVRDNSETLQTSLYSYSCLLDGQPDLVTEESLKFIFEVLEETERSDIGATLVRILKFSCTKHEGNRVLVIKLNGIEKVLCTAEKFKDSQNVVKEACGMLRTLTLDDDVRVTFGKAHEHTKKVVQDHKGLERLFDFMRAHESDPALASELCSTMGKLMVRNEFCQQMVDLGGLETIIRIFDAHMTRQNLMKQCITLVKAISGNDDVKVAVVKSGIVDHILKALSQHASNAQICEACFAALTTLTLRNPSHCDAIMSKNAALLMTQAMKTHSDHAGVQKQACMAIRNLVARTRHHVPVFIENGTEKLIRKARSDYGEEMDDVAKAALRDLEVEVDLKERWRGQNPGIAS